MGNSFKAILFNMCFFFAFVGMTYAGNITHLTHQERTDLEQSFISNPSATFLTLVDPLAQEQDNPNFIQRTWKVKLVYGREDKSDVAGNYFSYEVSYNLEDEGGTVIQSGTLRIFHSESSGLYESLEKIQNNTPSAKLVITGICGAEEGTNPLLCLGSGTNDLGFEAPDIRLELQLDVEKIYYLDYITEKPGLFHESIYVQDDQSKVNLAWSFIPGFEEYELEYVFWDDLADDFPATSESDYEELVFENAIRISTWKNNFELNVSYPSGNLYYRVRGIGRFIKNPANRDIKKYGKWSDIKQDEIGGAGVLQPFESGKNWQYTVSFAEEGKYKKVMSYYDGSLRNRQVLTNLSDAEMTLVAETDYSVEGQGVLSILPSPIGEEKGTNKNNLFFKNDFNQNINGETYSYRDFDKLTGAEPLSTISGAGKYYSPDNTSDGIYKDYIADAFQFPLTQARYLRDATGRMAAQGGVGDFYQLGTDRETRYYYLNAKSTELRRLFGANVGDARHYKKNLVVDPNGQVSVSYLDQSGRVIATALMGDHPDNVIQLDNSDEETVILDLMESNEIVGLSSSSHNTLFNSKPTVYTFNYSLKGVMNEMPSLNFCETCQYELTITIKDNDGNEIEEASQSFGKNINCTGGYYGPTALDPSISITLQEIGTYHVYKKLKVVGDHRNIEELQTYLETNNLLPDLETYIQNAIANIDYTQCAWSCQEYCNLQLIAGTSGYMDAEGNVVNTIIWFDSEGTLDPTYLEDYNLAMNECVPNGCIDAIEENPFEVGAAGECDSYLAQMKLQVSPLGDDLYINNGLDNFGSGDEDLGSNDFSNLEFFVQDVNGIYYTIQNGSFVFSTNNPPTNIPTTINILNIVTGAEQPITPSNFVSTHLFNPELWQDQWADALVINHREYCLYQICLETNSSPNSGTESSYTYNLKISSANTWQEVEGASYATDSWGVNILSGMIAEDPFFEGGYTYLGTCSQSREQDLTTILGNFPQENGSTGNIFTAIEDFITTNTGNNSVPYNLSDPEVADQVRWNLLRGAYINAKIQITMSCHDCGTGLPLPTTEEQALFVIPDLEAILNSNPGGPPTLYTDFCVDACAGQAQTWFQQINNELLANGCTEIPLASATNLIALLETYCIGNCNDGDNSSLVTELESGDPNLQPIIDEINNLTSGTGCLSGGQVIINNIVPDPSIYAGTGSIIDPCFLEALEALNEDVLPTTTGPQSTIGYTGCFATITTQAGYYEVKITFKNPLCVDEEGAGVQLMKFTVRDENGSVIPLFETESFTNPTIADLPTSFPNNYLADAYSGVSVQVNPSDGSPSYAGYIVFSLDGGNLDCTVITLGEEEIPFPDGCVDNLIAEATTIATEQWQQDVDNILTEYYNELENCMDITETFNVEYINAEYHYTLYYYDQAGNLVQTVTPEGVDPVDQVHFPNGLWDGTLPGHDQLIEITKHITKYEYNSIQQVTSQVSPDGGETEFYYNTAGQLRLSQNEKQVADGNTDNLPGTHFSYTKYDKQARIIEVGQMEDYAISNALEVDLNNLDFPSGIETYGLTQTVNTTYDDATTTAIVQENLRGRVTSSKNEHLTTHYAYDVHGNVEEILHNYHLPEDTEPSFNNPGMSDVRIVYDYDLISGNVNEVQYQPEKVDEFYHRYEYDADNRLTHVYTSRDGDIWDKDARYFYYVHGPLARVEIGDDKVQGMDYYYNLQGWIKGVNQTGLNSHEFEMGRDGNSMVTNINQNIARDEYAYSLGYNQSDFSPIGGNNANLGASPNGDWSNFNNDILSKTFGQDPNPTMGLVNGNITMMTTDIKHFYDAGTEGLQTMAYQYDQLHRIKKASSYAYNGTNWIKNDNYTSTYSYDRNGNINGLTRNGHLGQMDDLQYIYNDIGNKPNQLLSVNDQLGSGSNALYDNDVDGGQIGTNYIYDNIGNLISDDSEHIERVEWNVQGKVDAVIFNTAGHALGRKDIVYTYDPAGNRLSKKIINFNGNNEKITYYSRDASGNVMSIYESQGYFIEDQGFVGLGQKEVSLYGSNRLGLENFTERIVSSLYPPPTLSTTSTRKRGQKTFEMSNHLTNVLVTLSDKVQGVSTGGNANEADYYEAIVASANDYYPFGLAMPGRKDAQDYRYGFNGKENDKDWGTKFIQDYGFRLYNPSIAKFLSVDPLTKKYPMLTPYQFASNSPIASVDLDGLESYFAADGTFIRKFGESTEIRIVMNSDWKQIRDQSTNSNPNEDQGNLFRSELEKYSKTGYRSQHQAALNFAYDNLSKSIEADVEFGAVIYSKQVTDGDGVTLNVFMLGKIAKGGKDGAGEYVNLGDSRYGNYFWKNKWEEKSAIHTHIPLGKNETGDSEEFSAYSNPMNPLEKGDRYVADSYPNGFYLVTPTGKLKMISGFVNELIEYKKEESLIREGIPTTNTGEKAPIIPKLIVNTRNKNNKEEEK